MTVTGDQNSSNNTRISDGASDSFGGGAGDDTLLGYGGNDTIQGARDSDSIDGGSGDDMLYGRIIPQIQMETEMTLFVEETAMI